MRYKQKIFSLEHSSQAVEHTYIHIQHAMLEFPKWHINCGCTYKFVSHVYVQKSRVVEILSYILLQVAFLVTNYTDKNTKKQEIAILSKKVSPEAVAELEMFSKKAFARSVSLVLRLSRCCSKKLMQLGCTKLRRQQMEARSLSDYQKFHITKENS